MDTAWRLGYHQGRAPYFGVIVNGETNTTNPQHEYTAEFRSGAVQMVRETCRLIAQSRALPGIGTGAMGTWVSVRTSGCGGSNPYCWAMGTWVSVRTRSSKVRLRASPRANALNRRGRANVALNWKPECGVACMINGSSEGGHAVNTARVHHSTEEPSHLCPTRFHERATDRPEPCSTQTHPGCRHCTRCRNGRAWRG